MFKLDLLFQQYHGNFKYKIVISYLWQGHQHIINHLTWMSQCAQSVSIEWIQTMAGR